ncbi:MAG TPA: manganese efflux pump MntP family protein [Anaerolineaceae bacterium]|nr:manganese efflux pump MntP family protein [Anaerolineaceae bacterium]
MQILTILLISLGLAMDCFAVSLAVGTCGQIPDLRGKLRLAAHFGIFQAGMTALGWILGGSLIQYVASWDHWIAFALLAYVAFKLLKSGLTPDCEAFYQDPSKGRTMVLLSVATSIDAFAVGLSIAFMNVPILLSVISIGVVSALLSIIGLFGGHRLSCQFGKRMEIVGALVLLFIGFRVVVTHLGILS